jgi:hypothetical protein
MLRIGRLQLQLGRTARNGRIMPAGVPLEVRSDRPGLGGAFGERNRRRGLGRR